VSPKLDGIRALTFKNTVYSRSWKPLRSLQVQEDFGAFPFLDGEIIAGEATADNVYNNTQSFVMSYDKPGDLTYYVFDYYEDISLPYNERLSKLEKVLNNIKIDNIKLLKHHYVHDADALLEVEEDILAQGYEGLILRNPKAPYKLGRATWNDNIIYKLKRFQEDECRIIGFEERMHNTNAQTTNAQGYAERSSSKEGLVGAGMVGKIIVDYKGEMLEVAPGSFNHEQLKKMFWQQDKYIGKLLKFRFMRYGMKDKPRFPRASGFRDEDDL
jgi:DNA ligase-1